MAPDGDPGRRRRRREQRGRGRAQMAALCSAGVEARGWRRLADLGPRGPASGPAGRRRWEEEREGGALTWQAVIRRRRRSDMSGLRGEKCAVHEVGEG